MLTLAKVTSGAAAVSYYESADDYYADDGQASSAWWGAGAEVLGFAGSVDTVAFKALLEGELPDGVTMHHGGEGQRRAGSDLTFSAPKSVSMQALIAGDRRLLAAHDTAVARVLAHIENRLAACRVTVGGDTYAESTDNLLVACFRHDLSRDADPQLHTHAVLLNLTQRDDGQWRALDAAPLYVQQKLLGALYRAELAREVLALGYAVRATHADGRFELAHLTDADVAAFSSRSRAIVGALAQLGKDRSNATAAEREIATLASRKAKGQLDRTTLRQLWQDKSAALAIDYTAQPPVILNERERSAQIAAAVDFAILHLTERRSIVRHDALVGWALGGAIGVASVADIEAELATRVADGSLLMSSSLYTTVAAQTLERELLDIEERGRGALLPILHKTWLPDKEDNFLNAGQLGAVRLILTSAHRVVGVQGRAGTGKTRMLTAVSDQAAALGWRCVGLAPSAAAAQEVGAARIEATTIAGFLARNGGGLDTRTLVVLDEAGMVSARDMHAVLTAVERSGARLVLVGDTRQLKAVQAGIPFAQLQAAGMATAFMRDIQRQTSAALKAAVEHAADGEVAASLALLKPRIAEVAYARERYAAIARHYTALLPQARQDTLIVAGTHAAREAINGEVRARLNLQGAPVCILVGRDLTEAQRKSTVSYQPGDVVQVQKAYASLGLARGELAVVVSTQAGRVTLRREDGQLTEWRPALMPHVAVYVINERDMAVGDRVRVNANDYGLGLVNGQFGTVSAMTPQTLTLIRESGTQVVLDLRRPLHLEHGYCTTVHSAQGQTCERVMIDADVKSATANESLYYVAISRPRSEVLMYTDDRELLPIAMSQLDNKVAALDLTRPRESMGL
jgi:conjugative relaxase-like TrwC/TraI family protein